MLNIEKLKLSLNLNEVKITDLIVNFIFTMANHQAEVDKFTKSFKEFIKP